MPAHMRSDAVFIDSPHNSWNKALNTLGAELRDSLDLTKLRHGEVLNRALREAQVKAVVESRNSVQSKQSIMTTLLDRDSNFKITDSLLNAAMDTRHVELLLDCRTEDQLISSELLEKAAKEYFEGGKLASLLFKHDKSIRITPAVVRSVINCNGDMESFFKTLFQHDPTLDITSEDLIGLVQVVGPGKLERVRRTLNVLLEFPKTIEFTAEVREALDNKISSHSDKDIKESFYQLERR